MSIPPDSRRRLAEAFARSREQGADDDGVALLTEIERHRLEAALGENTEGGAVLSVPVAVVADALARLRRLELLLEAQGAADLVVGTGAVQGGVSPHLLSSENPLRADSWFPPACGFHHLEYDAGGAFRWTGPSHEFRVDVALDRTIRHELELRLAGALHQYQLDGLALYADNGWVPLVISGAADGFRYRFVLPAMVQAETTALIFVVPQMLRPADHDGGGDWRPLGVRFRSLALVEE